MRQQHLLENMWESCTHMYSYMWVYIYKRIQDHVGNIWEFWKRVKDIYSMFVFVPILWWLSSCKIFGRWAPSKCMWSCLWFSARRTEYYSRSFLQHTYTHAKAHTHTHKSRIRTPHRHYTHTYTMNGVCKKIKWTYLDRKSLRIVKLLFASVLTMVWVCGTISNFQRYWKKAMLSKHSSRQRAPWEREKATEVVRARTHETRKARGADVLYVETL